MEHKLLLNEYVESKKYAWSESTKKSQSSRINKVLQAFFEKSPEELWEHLCKFQAPYTRTTTWVAISDFADWLIETGRMHGSNLYRIFRKKHRLQFRNVYQRQYPSIDHREAERRIQNLSDEATKKKALELFRSGMRWSESLTFNKGKVLGKGSKQRSVYKPDIAGPEYRQSYATFLRRLKSVDLKPHDLRKLAATKLSTKISLIDLCHVMGWEDPKTAMCYLQPAKEEKLMSIVKKTLA